jgi:hypothetical protein
MACAAGGRRRRGARWRRGGKGAGPAAVEAACAICRCCSRLKARLLSCPVRGKREVRGESREMSLVCARACVSYPPCHHPRLCPRPTCGAGGREDGGRGGVTLRGMSRKAAARSRVAPTPTTSTPPAPPNLPSSSLSAPARGNASFRLSFPPHIQRRHLRSRRRESARTHATSPSRQAVCTHARRRVRGEVSQHGIPRARAHAHGPHERLVRAPRELDRQGRGPAKGRASFVGGGHDLWRRTRRRRSPWGGR